MAMQFTILPVEPGATVPNSSEVSSVALIAIDGTGKILVTEHKERGWDIPGGHLEDGENAMTALEREVKEEAGATFQNPVFIATITSNAKDERYRGKSMVIFATRHFVLADGWEPSDDVTSRAVLDVDAMMRGYYGDKDDMIALLNHAAKRLGIFPRRV